MRRTLAVAAAVLLTGCNGNPTSPAPIPTPTPEVTLSVRGSVRDTMDRLLAGVRVEVITGRLAGIFVMTNDSGAFAFAQPLPLASQIKASKPGYQDTVTTIYSAVPIVFRLSSPDPPISFTGQFDITFEADAMCGTLSESARKRTYQAALRSTTELSGATFLGGDPPFNLIQLTQFGAEVKFSLHDPPIWELIPNGTHVMITGEALGMVEPNFNELQLTMFGEFKYCPSFSTGAPGLCSAPTVSCWSERHLITVRRR